ARARCADSVAQKNAASTVSGTNAATSACRPAARTRSAAMLCCGVGAACGLTTRPASPAATPTASASGASSPASARYSAEPVRAVLVDQRLHAPHAEPRAPLGEEEGAGIAGAGLEIGQLVAALQVRAQRLHRLAAQRHDPLLAALAEDAHAAQRVVRGVDGV